MRLRIFNRILSIKLFELRTPAPAAPEKKPRGNASEDWWSSFCFGGSIVADCVCGRTNFVDREDAGDWDEGELEKLREKHKENPDAYPIDHGNDRVSISSIGLIWNCPCGESKRHEEYLIVNEDAILSYYKKLHEHRVFAANQSAIGLEQAGVK